MTITQETVEHVAKLARLELEPSEVLAYTKDLSNILTLVEQLNELELSAVEVGLNISEAPVMRPDQASREFTRSELMANAPHEEEGFFRVPKILADDD